MELVFQSQTTCDDDEGEVGGKDLENTSKDEESDDSDMSSFLDIGIDEGEAQCKLDIISTEVAHIVELDKSQVQCRYLKFSRTGFRCKVCLNFKTFANLSKLVFW